VVNRQDTLFFIEIEISVLNYADQYKYTYICKQAAKDECKYHFMKK